MEAIEDPTLEPAIGWLADTILANLRAGGKLDSWILQAGLGNDIGKLRSEVEMVVSAVQGRAAGNKPLTRSLTAVKELLYDADDVVDELDYCMLQQQLEPETLLEADGHGGVQQAENSRENVDDVQSSSNGRLRSKEWVHFDIIESEQNEGLPEQDASTVKKRLCATQKWGHPFCAITSRAKVVATNVEQLNLLQAPPMLLQFLRMLQLVIRPAEKGLEHITTANKNGWNKDEFSERIQDITSQLQVKREGITKLRKILGPDSGGASLNHCQSTYSDPRRRTSSLVQGKVYGRAAEKSAIKKLIEEHKSTAGVTVLPIVGIGGVGKTALAQLMYNDPALESEFDHKIWIWVPNNFDEMRLTREMLDCVSQETHDCICSFPKLQ